MLRRTLWTAGAAAVLSLPLFAPALTAQGVPIKTEDMPLTKDLGLPSGLDVTPAWEGWYPNEDGTATIYFGYYNRNREEVVHIPIGPDNQVTVAGQVVEDAGQPSSFDARRNYGVFGVKVPGDFDGEVVWTLKHDGRTFSIPGSLNPVWKTDQMEGDADGNFGPTIRFTENGAGVQGPLGVWASQTLTTTVGTPLDVTVYGTHVRSEAAEGAAPEATGGPGGFGGGRGGRSRGFRIEWDLHGGPGAATFDPTNGNIPDDGGSATTTVTFAEPGDYVVRATASRGGVAGNGHSQCCWTNGYVRVTVTGR